jgi:hypothetical protein
LGETSPIVVEPSPATEVNPPTDAPAQAASRPAPISAAPAIAAAPAAPAPGGVPERPRRERHGLALALGAGFSMGILGVQARYDIPVRRRLTVSPFVAAGVLFGLLAGPAGVTTTFGARHRLAVDLGVAPLIRAHLILHGTPVEGQVIYGPCGGIGYEHMSDGGWLQRVTFDFGYATWGSPVPPATPYVGTIGFAFGRRIW